MGYFAVGQDFLIPVLPVRGRGADLREVDTLRIEEMSLWDATT